MDNALLWILFILFILGCIGLGVVVYLKVNNKITPTMIPGCTLQEGHTGSTGEDGQKGSGPRGDVGDQGHVGHTGLDGIKGPTGPTGQTGSPGGPCFYPDPSKCAQTLPSKTFIYAIPTSLPTIKSQTTQMLTGGSWKKTDNILGGTYVNTEGFQMDGNASGTFMAPRDGYYYVSFNFLLNPTPDGGLRYAEWFIAGFGFTFGAIDPVKYAPVTLKLREAWTADVETDYAWSVNGDIIIKLKQGYIIGIGVFNSFVDGADITVNTNQDAQNNSFINIKSLM